MIFFLKFVHNWYLNVSVIVLLLVKLKLMHPALVQREFEAKKDSEQDLRRSSSASSKFHTEIIPDSGTGFGYIVVSPSSFQNGPDGIALIDNADNVIQFLSYEGTLTATNGPASGMTSTNIGVSESSSTALGFSLQLQGTGSSYGDFSWASPQSNTFGSVNNGQTFNAGSGPQASNVFSGLAAGTYTFNVSDANGCTAFSTITIGEPSLLVASSSAPQILCIGGTTTVAVSASGGVPPYTGTGTFTENEGTFTYIVTDANGCTFVAGLTITEPSVLMANISTTPSVPINHPILYILQK